MKTIEIDVTEEVIAEARMLVDSKLLIRSVCCPVALALKNKGLVAVVLVESWYERHEGSKIQTLPRDAQNFINAFDTGADVKPAKFTLTMEGE